MKYKRIERDKDGCWESDFREFRGVNYNGEHDYLRYKKCKSSGDWILINGKEFARRKNLKSRIKEKEMGGIAMSIDITTGSYDVDRFHV